MQSADVARWQPCVERERAAARLAGTVEIEIEIELRLGRCGARFDGRVDVATWNAVRERLDGATAAAGGVTLDGAAAAPALLTCVRQEQWRETSDHVYASGERYTFERDAVEPCACIVKRHVYGADTACPDQLYDVRFDVAFEQHVALASAPFARARVVHVRRKRRLTYRIGDAIAVELTEVRDDDGLHHECELEIVWPLERTLTLEHARDVAARADALWRWLVPPMQHPELLRSRYIALARAPALVRRHVAALCAQSAPPALQRRCASATHFAGAMPVTLARRDVAHVAAAAAHYYVCDKSDGERLMLYVEPRQGVFFVDRRSVVYRIDTAHASRAMLLDGELVRDRRTQTWMYVAFDAISIDNESFAHLRLSERMAALAVRVVAPLRRASFLPFPLCAKPLYPLVGHIDTLLAHIDHNERTYRDARRHYAVDGLLFVPDERGVRPFACTRHGALLGTYKWKYGDMHTVDLRAVERASDGAVALCCASECGEIECLRASRFRENDAVELRACARARRIVEVGYDDAGGAWRLVAHRDNKSTPNHASVVISVLEASADRVGVHELRAIASAATSYDDDDASNDNGAPDASSSSSSSSPPPANASARASSAWTYWTQ